MNYKSLKLLFCCILFISLYSCSSNQIISTKLDKPIKIDGNYQEWDKSIKYVDEQQFAYGISHDENNMYICLVKSGRQAASQLARNGIIIWFKPEDEKALQFGLKIKTPDLLFSKSSNKNKSRRKTQRSGMLNRLRGNRELQIINTKGEILENINIPNDLRINFKPSLQNEILAYELSIPLKRSVNFPYSAGVNSDNSVNIKFESAKPELKNRKKISGRQSGNNRGGNKGNRMGGKGIQRGQGKNSDRSKSISTILIEYEVEVNLNK